MRTSRQISVLHRNIRWSLKAGRASFIEIMLIYLLLEMREWGSLEMIRGDSQSSWDLCSSSKHLGCLISSELSSASASSGTIVEGWSLMRESFSSTDCYCLMIIFICLHIDLNYCTVPLAWRCLTYNEVIWAPAERFAKGTMQAEAFRESPH
jgi:hypothetical protein